jgi:hypothetical protein
MEAKLKPNFYCKLAAALRIEMRHEIIFPADYNRFYASSKSPIRDLGTSWIACLSLVRVYRYGRELIYLVAFDLYNSENKTRTLLQKDAGIMGGY